MLIYQLLTEEVDLNQYPSIRADKKTTREITVGDLHGNALKLLYILLKEGLFILDAENYKHFVDIYNTPAKDLSTADLTAMQAIIVSAIVPNKKLPLLRLIGDELADRGQNDYFTLLLFKHMTQLGIAFEILYSNHSAEFIYALKNNCSFATTKLLNVAQACSMTNLEYLLQKRLVKRKTILSLAYNYYLQHVKLISYTLDKNGITIYTHAPVGLEIIKMLAQNFIIAYHDETALTLAHTIAQINQEYNIRYAANDLLLSSQENYNASAGYHLAWNRELTTIDRPEQLNDYKIFFVHGHDNAPTNSQHIINLDNELGKGMLNAENSLNQAQETLSIPQHKGQYAILTWGKS